jgi:predicted Zn-dependent peptidase
VTGGIEQLEGASLLCLVFTCRSNATAAALAETRALLADAASGGLTSEEIAVGRRAIADAAPLRFSTAAGVADALARLQSVSLDASQYDAHRDAVVAINDDHARGAAARWLHPGRMGFVVLGDAAVVEPGLAQSADVIRA